MFVHVGCFSADNDGDGDDEVGDEGAEDDGPCVELLGTHGCAEIVTGLFGQIEVCQCYAQPNFEIFIDEDAAGHEFLTEALAADVIAACEAAIPSEFHDTLCQPELVVLTPGDQCVELVCQDGGNDGGDNGNANVAGAGLPPATYGIASFDEVVSCSRDVCEVSGWFVDMLVADPTLLFDDPARVRTVGDVGPGGLRFEGITSGSFAGALGLSDGEILQAVNGVSLADTGDVVMAVWELGAETEFVADIVGPSGPRRSVFVLR